MYFQHIIMLFLVYFQKKLSSINSNYNTFEMHISVLYKIVSCIKLSLSFAKNCIKHNFRYLICILCLFELIIFYPSITKYKLLIFQVYTLHMFILILTFFFWIYKYIYYNVCFTVLIWIHILKHTWYSLLLEKNILLSIMRILINSNLKRSKIL